MNPSHPTNGIPESPCNMVRASDFSEALALVMRDDDCFVEVFVHNWADVDQHRAQAAAMGLSARVGVHHFAALDAVVRLGVRRGSPQDPPSPPGQLGVLTRLLEYLAHAGSALCRTRVNIGSHRKALI